MKFHHWVAMIGVALSIANFIDTEQAGWAAAACFAAQQFART